MKAETKRKIEALKRQLKSAKVQPGNAWQPKKDLKPEDVAQILLGIIEVIESASEDDSK